MTKILFLGDIVGRAGRTCVTEKLGEIRETGGYDLIIANGENAAAGAGITGKIAQELHDAGLDGITLGDHCWDQRNFPEEIDGLPFLSRPFNLPGKLPGKPHLIVEASNGFRLGVVTMLGDHFMKVSADHGFSRILEYVQQLKRECDSVFVEIHAEATAEKVALGWYLDGVVGAVIGTHTHIPTADARILTRGTAYMTDAGMSGPYDSVIGRHVEPVIARSLDGMPRKFTVATENVKLCGVSIEFEKRRGLATAIERFELSVPYAE